jgi:putative heme-binding domain-containing protein
LDLEQRRTLLRWSSGAITKRAKSYFGDEEYSNRKVLVEEWLDKLPASGDITIGKKLFETHCALCHQVGSLGKNVGPNLTGVSHRSVEDLLSHILDPNMAINPNYVTCVVETNDGTVFTGLLAEDDAKGISLKLAQGLEQRVPRQSIKRKEVVATSLMPEGMEAAITPQQMRDLIAFLQES